MAYLADSIWVNVSTSGTADFTTTTALAGYRTFADASTPNGSTIHYSARSATQFENGEGIYSSGTGIVTRATIFASSSAGAKVNFSVSPTLVVAPLAEDFGASAITIGTTTITGGTTTRVLYDLAGVVQESSAFTISSNQPNVAAGNSYKYDGTPLLAAQQSLENIYVGITSNYNFTATGTQNIGIGGYSLIALTDGLSNIAVGRGALTALTGGDRNVAIGANAMFSCTLGSDNLVVGYNVSPSLTDGSGNIFVGGQTGAGITTGTYNTILGFAVQSLSSGLSDALILASGSGGTIRIDYNKTAASVLTLNADTAVLGTLRLQGYTIGGTLPAAGTAGRRAYVTNSAASPAFMATLTGGGSTIAPVFDDGTNWRYG